jgi:Ca2+-binding RTX toxin-like protein
MSVIELGPEANAFTPSAAGDIVYGGDGADTLTALAGGNTLHGDAGDDVLNGAEGNDYLDGGSDLNLIEHNVLNGGGGDDTILSGSYGDQISAGSGDDTVQVSAIRDGQVVDGGGGSDTLFLLALTGFTQSVYVQLGSTFQPIVGGVNGASYIGFETLYVVGGTGSNTLIGGAGNDTLINTYSNVSSFQGGTLRGGGGNDVIEFYGLPPTGGGIMQASGGAGSNDKLVWGNGLAFFTDIEVDVAAGTMTSSGTEFGHFTGFEQVRIQTFFGATGTVTFTGGAGVDTLDIAGSSSTLSTLGGADTVLVRTGTSLVHAGQGDDVVQVDFDNGATQSLFGDGGNDRILGGSGIADMTGGDGNDTITAYNGRSHISGGAGADVLVLTSSYSMSGSGAAVIAGGTGRDTLSLTYSTFSTAFLASFASANITLVDGTTISGVEAISFQGGSGNDRLIASNDAAGVLANYLGGGVGNDTLRASSAGALLDGGTGNDLLLGGTGADKLDGSLGDDILRGGDGHDILIGGFGRDVMTGGLGADHFVFAAATQTGNTKPTRDVIVDFSKAELDKIDLSAIDADGNFGNGKTAFSYIGTTPFGDHAGELRYQKVNLVGTANDVTLIIGDTTGDGTADFQIALKGLFTLTIGDFILA